MVGREISVKLYVVRLSVGERERLETLIRRGQGSAQRLVKARILLKADASPVGPGWSDSEIVEALETSQSTVGRVRKQFVGEGLEAVLSRKQRATSADVAALAAEAAAEGSVRRYVVRLSPQERERLETLIGTGQGPAQRLLKARILLKADVSPMGSGWNDRQIIEALDTCRSMVVRVRKQLVEEGLEAVLSRKLRATPPVARIFDGEKEARLIALACSRPPEGFARWSLRLLEERVVELNIVDHASDSTIGRVLKKILSSPIAKSAGSFPPGPTPPS